MVLRGHGVQGHRVILPSNREYSVDQLRRLLRQVERALGRAVELNEWLAIGK